MTYASTGCLVGQLFLLLAFALAGCGVGNAVAAEHTYTPVMDPQAPLRRGQIYTWAQRQWLLQRGQRRKAEAIPYPGLWNRQFQSTPLSFKGRRWDCAQRDQNDQCLAVRLLGQ